MLRKRLILRGIVSYLSHLFGVGDEGELAIWVLPIPGDEGRVVDATYSIRMYSESHEKFVPAGIEIHYTGIVSDRSGHHFDLRPIQHVTDWARACGIRVLWSDEDGELDIGFVPLFARRSSTTN
jgi:hypothetical protein